MMQAFRGRVLPTDPGHWCPVPNIFSSFEEAERACPSCKSKPCVFWCGCHYSRWLYVLAAATPRMWGDPLIVDETLEPIDTATIQAGDVVGIRLHTGNALRGYEVGREARARGAWVVFGGIHSTLFPDEAHEVGGAHAVVRGDGDLVWSRVIQDCANSQPERVYEGGRVGGDQFLPARWDLLQRERYMWASVQTVRGCPKIALLGMARTVRTSSAWRRGCNREVRVAPLGILFIALADDYLGPVTLADEMARKTDPPPPRTSGFAPRDLTSWAVGLPAHDLIFLPRSPRSCRRPGILGCDEARPHLVHWWVWSR
jgi:hypothetical protein